MRYTTLEYFQAVPKNTLLRLRYDATNSGEFWWLHDRVEGDRVWGGFRYDGEDWVGIDDYLYEFMGEVCRGSGAEPLRLLTRLDPAKDPDRYRDVLGPPVLLPELPEAGESLQRETVLALPAGTCVLFTLPTNPTVQRFRYAHANGLEKGVPYGFLLEHAGDDRGVLTVLHQGESGLLLGGQPVQFHSVQLAEIHVRVRNLQLAG